MIITNTVGEKQIVVQMGETFAEIEQQMFLWAYENSGFNVTKTAKALGIHIRTARAWKNKYACDEVKTIQAESIC